ncbi:MAG: ABC transporter permease [Steroidobacteraceae bacterium]|jgi:putative ABC transport system permease protein|nr:ABC transporter permease [Steroidobacteraceae bacterium]
MSARLWAQLTLAQWRDQPLRTLVTLLAIAVGVMLASAVWFVNSGALAEFGQATRRLVGEADLVVRGPSRTGFDESLYPALAALPGVETASPVLELEVALAGRRGPLRVLGVDPFRAGQIQPLLFGELSGDFFGLFERDGVFLSVAAAEDLGVRPGGRFEVLVGTESRSLRVLGLLSREAYPQRLGIMDIASAQWTLGRLGALNRIDLRLAPGTAPAAFRERLARVLPAGVQAIEPAVERDRAVSVTRAYRVNLNMLALVSLLTGAFLVFSTQSLSVLRRRTGLALLRALGLTRAQLQRALFAEGLLLGALGSLLGVVAGHLGAAWLLRRIGGDLGGGQLAVTDAALAPQPLAALAFFAIGTVVASAGAWAPARDAASRPPAQALKAGDAEPSLARLRGVAPGLALLAVGAALAFLPAVGGIPVFGYLAVAALLFGGVLLVPRVTATLLARAPRTGRIALDAGLAQLRGGIGQVTVGLAAVIVSFSLMVAMAIMVFSFRESFVRWLGGVLPADVQLRVAQGSDTGYLEPDRQRALATLPGIERVEFRRLVPLLLDPALPAITVIARDFVPGSGPEVLPLVREAPVAAAQPGDARLPRAWISEAVEDLYGWRPGDARELSFAGRRQRFRIAGVFRDYGRSTGAIVVDRAEYARLSGDARATEASFWLAPGTRAAAAIAAIRARLPGAGSAELLESTQVREISLRIFDRAFLVTYALEAVAVGIGLLGVAFAASSGALARRGEFAMLRHLGMLRRQVLAMLAGEGLLTSLIGVLYGLLLGGLLSLVLVYVINRQSFNWSVELAVPGTQLAAISFALVLAAALTATLSGRAAMSGETVRAVREDW